MFKMEKSRRWVAGAILIAFFVGTAYASTGDSCDGTGWWLWSYWECRIA